MINLMIKN